MNLYIDYSEFELTCWNTDGKGTNVAIPLTEEQAKKYFDKKKRASLKRKCYKPSKIKGFRVFRQLTIFNVLVNFCLLECKIIFNYAVNLCLTLQ